MFNLNHFYYFYILATTGSVTAASKVLRISQPALSKQIKIFEKSLNKKLVERHGRGLQLTSAGLSLFGHARSMFEKVEYLSRNFGPSSRLEHEHVRLGMGASIDRSFVADLSSEFLISTMQGQEFQFSLSISSIAGESIARYLKEQVIDCALAEGRISSPDLISVGSRSSPFCLLVPAKYSARLRNVRKDNFKEIVTTLNLPWVVPTFNLRTRQVVEDTIERNGLELQHVLESDSILTIVRSVEHSVGIALIPQHYLCTIRCPKQILVFDSLRLVPQVALHLLVRKADRNRGFAVKLAKAFNSVMG